MYIPLPFNITGHILQNETYQLFLFLNRIPEQQGGSENLSGLSSLVANRNKLKAALESNEMNALKGFLGDYLRLPRAIRRRASWQQIMAKLLANYSKNLKSVMKLKGKGHLVNVNEKGQGVFKDRSPVLYGIDKKGAVLPMEDGAIGDQNHRETLADYFKSRERVQAEGYQLFSSDEVGGVNESDLVISESGQPFIPEAGGTEVRGAWLESGDNPTRSYCAAFNPTSQIVEIQNADPHSGYVLNSGHLYPVGVIRKLLV